MTKPNNFQTREEWLNFVMDEVRPVFKGISAPLPAKIRLSVGFTSNGYRGKSIGECWDSKAQLAFDSLSAMQNQGQYEASWCTNWCTPP